MDAKPPLKQKRHKKRKARTTEVSDDSESDTPREVSTSKITIQKTTTKSEDTESAFTKFYLQRATVEFAEDLDKIRGADDFKDEALPVLIHALQQGKDLFSVEEQRRIVLAGKKE